MFHYFRCNDSKNVKIITFLIYSKILQKKINLEVTVPTNNVKKKKRKRRKRKKKSKTSNTEHDILDEEDDNDNVNDPDKKDACIKPQDEHFYPIPTNLVKKRCPTLVSEVKKNV